MILLAVQEWERFGRQTIDYRSGEAHIEHQGVQEREASERVRDFWKSVDRPNLTGLDTEVPWSAAFISWDIASAGVPRSAAKINCNRSFEPMEMKSHSAIRAGICQSRAGTSSMVPTWS